MRPRTEVEAGLGRGKRRQESMGRRKESRSEGKETARTKNKIRQG